MNKNAIYFPYIEVPNNDWLIKTLLYWDKFSTIVPHEEEESFVNKSKMMQSLNSANLINIIKPMNFSESSELKHFYQRFLLFATKWKEKNPTYNGSNSKIHMEKLGSIQENLQELGIIRPDSHYPWFLMPTKLSNTFMLGLASHLGYIEDIKAEPVTDILYKRKMTARNAGKTYNINFWQNKLLEDVIPVPLGDVSIDQLLKFKDDYKERTIGFRYIIEKNSKALAMIETDDPEELAFEYKKHLNEIKCRHEEIEEYMKSSFNSITKNSLSFITSSALSAKLFYEGNPAGLASVSNAGVAIHNIYEEIKKINKNKKSPYTFISGINKF